MAHLLAYLEWNGNPAVVDFGFIALRWYPLFFLVAFVLSYRILKKRFENDAVPARYLDKLTVYIVVAAIVGARLGHCLFYDFEYYRDHLLEIVLPVTFDPSFEFIGYRGLASHGGAIAILIAVILFCRKFGVSLSWILDKLALVIPLAGFLIRLGNFFNSEMVGTPTTVPWAIIFHKVDNLPRHPGQLYEAALYLLIFATLHRLDKKEQRYRGFLFGVFLILLFSARFFVEFFKENQVVFENSLPLNMGQILSIPFIVLGILLVIGKRKNEGRMAINNWL